MLVPCDGGCDTQQAGDPVLVDATQTDQGGGPEESNEDGLGDGVGAEDAVGDGDG